VVEVGVRTGYGPRGRRGSRAGRLSRAMSCATPWRAVVTISGLQLGALLAGVSLSRSSSTWPGMNQLLYNAAEERDYPVVQGVVIVVAVGRPRSKICTCSDGIHRCGLLDLSAGAAREIFEHRCDGNRTGKPHAPSDDPGRRRIPRLMIVLASSRGSAFAVLLTRLAAYIPRAVAGPPARYRTVRSRTCLAAWSTSPGLDRGRASKLAHRGCSGMAMLA